MTTEAIIDQIKMQPDDGLKQIYEAVGEEYRKRLLAAWDIDYNDSFWIFDQIGNVLIIGDADNVEYAINFEDARLFLDNGISFEDFESWYLNSIDDAGSKICAYAWFIQGIRQKR